MGKAPELKPCPFCGARPHRGLSKVMHDQLHGDPYQDTIIKCPHLCTTMEGGEETVVERWNTRADLRPVVKPLVWRTKSTGNGSIAHGLGVMYVYDHDHDCVVVAMHEGSSTLKSAFDSEEQAKEWAQSKENNRILARLDLAPMTPAQAAKDALIAAAYSVEKRAEEIVQKHLPVSAFNELRDVAKGLRAIAEGESNNA